MASKSAMEPYTPDDESKAINIRAHYEGKDLIEISIIRSPVKIPRQLIVAFSYCIPFHPTLTRLTFRYGGLNQFIIYEISKFLPHSNITHICFDDSYVPQGNYNILLEETSQLIYLSLNRCKINDEVCKRIAMNLSFGKPAAEFLRALELGSNNITDSGAQCLGTALRTNRCLMHLNVSGNKITDKGASTILDALKEFRLTDDEVLDMKRRKYRFLENKHAVYKRCLGEIKHQMASTAQLHKAHGVSGKNLATKKTKKSGHTTPVPNTLISGHNLNPEDFAEKMAAGVVGEFVDPFGHKTTKVRAGRYYCEGNFVLCSLNLAYNDLHYPSLQKLDEVVTCQVSRSGSLLPTTESDGLLRIVIEGNFMPESCDELDRILFFLKAKCGSKTNQSKRHGSNVSTRSKSRALRQGIASKKSTVAFDK